VCFLGYRGATVYGSGRDRRAGTHRFVYSIRKYRQVAVAMVEPPIKRCSQTKFADSRGGFSAESPRHGDTEVDR
jgi:hypothetical protein